MTREEAIERLRVFNANLDGGPPASVARFRARPLAESLESVRGFVPDEVLNPLLAAVAEHGIGWSDITYDVYSVAASFIVSALRPGEKR